MAESMFGHRDPGCYYVVFVNNQDETRIESHKNIPIPRVGEQVILSGFPLKEVKRVIHELNRRPLRVFAYVEDA